MIVGLPIVARLLRDGCSRKMAPGRETAILVATIFVVFVLATLKSSRRRDAGRAARALLPAGLRAGLAGGGLGTDRDGSMLACRMESGWRPWLAVTVLRAGLGRPDLGLRRVVAGQALSASLAGAARGGRVDPGQPATGFAPGADHDVVSLGAARHERPDHDPHAPKL